MYIVATKVILLRMRLGLTTLRDRPDGWLRQAYNRGSLSRWLRLLELQAAQQAQLFPGAETEATG